MLTGDSLWWGDLARPDLVVEAEAAGRAPRSSLERLLVLGDHVEIWPAQVGGSRCGGSGARGATHPDGLQRDTAELGDVRDTSAWIIGVSPAPSLSVAPRA